MQNAIESGELLESFSKVKHGSNTILTWSHPDVPETTAENSKKWLPREKMNQSET